jgi:hypothetical protein
MALPGAVTYGTAAVAVGPVPGSAADFNEDLRGIAVPVLVAHCDDQTVPIGGGREVAAERSPAAFIGRGFCGDFVRSFRAYLLAFRKE